MQAKLTFRHTHSSLKKRCCADQKVFQRSFRLMLQMCRACTISLRMVHHISTAPS